MTPIIYKTEYIKEQSFMKRNKKAFKWNMNAYSCNNKNDHI